MDLFTSFFVVLLVAAVGSVAAAVWSVADKAGQLAASHKSLAKEMARIAVFLEDLSKEKYREF